jgi:hypothetical protein
MMSVERLTKFMEVLASTGLNQAKLISETFDYALLGCRAEIAMRIPRDQVVPDALQLEAMERAAQLLSQVTGTVKNEEGN